MADLQKTITEGFAKKNIVIVGDLVADQFLNGTISRVSREAPVFILRHDDTATVPGAAANAAANVASLGGIPRLVGVVGSDASGNSLLSALGRSSVDTSSVVIDGAFSTTTKIRVLAGQHYAPRQQVIRIDYENNAPLSQSSKQALRDNLANCAEGADAIVMSDYNYGAIFEDLAADARDLAARLSIPLVVDSRYRLGSLRGATSATPNREEVEAILGRDFTEKDCFRLRETLELEALLVTNGNRGMTLFSDASEPIVIDAVGSKEPVDVTGAGDTVIAAYSLGLAAGLSFAEAATIANHAGGLVVMKHRTSTATALELSASVADRTS